MAPKEKGVEWTSAMVNRFAELVKDKQLRYREIAAKLSTEFGVNLTKNSCIGKGHRLGFDPRPEGMVRSVKVKEPKRRYVRIDAPILPVVVKPRDPNKGLTIYELREGDCKWILDELHSRPPFSYCGAPALFGRPWCKKHMNMAYAVPKLRSA